MNRNMPLLIAGCVGVISGYYIWEPLFKKYQRESKGTWQYEVVQQTRAEQLQKEAEARAVVLSAATATPSAAATLETSSAPASATNPPSKV